MNLLQKALLASAAALLAVVLFGRERAAGWVEAVWAWFVSGASPLVLAVALGGCASQGLSSIAAPTGGPPSAEARYAAVRLDYNAMLDRVVAYAVLPRCSAELRVSCSRQAVIDKAYPIAWGADLALDRARLALTGVGGFDQDAELRAAVGALTALQAILVAEMGG